MVRMPVAASCTLGLLIAFANNLFADESDAIKALAEKALKAVGGKEAISIQAWTLSATVVDHKDSRNSGKIRQYVLLPDRRRSELDPSTPRCPPAKVISVLNGTTGWVNSSGEAVELNADYVASYKNKLPPWITEAVMINDRDFQPQLLPDTKIRGKPSTVVRLTHKEFPPAVLYYETATALLLKSELNGGLHHFIHGWSRDSGSIETVYSDYKKVNGVAVPHKRTRVIDGELARETEITEFTLIDKLDAKLFEKP